MNGIDPFHDIEGIEVSDKNDTNHQRTHQAATQEPQMDFDEIEESADTNNMTIIGQSEINRLSLADSNGVISVPQTIIRLRSSKDFVRDLSASSSQLNIFPLKSPFRDFYNPKTEVLKQRLEDDIH